MLPFEPLRIIFKPLKLPEKLIADQQNNNRRTIIDYYRFQGASSILSAFLWADFFLRIFVICFALPCVRQSGQTHLPAKSKLDRRLGRL